MIESLQLGASLYVPATRPDLAPIGNRSKYPKLRSVIFCTEDAIAPRDVPAALRNIEAALRQFEPTPLLRFVRVRNPGVLRQVLAMDGVHNLTGFVLPKLNRHNVDEYFTPLMGPFRVMPILETADVFDPLEMAGLRTRLMEESYRNRVLSLRIGGNDLLQFLGLRRPRQHSIYTTPLRSLIAQLVANFRPHGFNLTGPAFEWLERDTLLAREARQDVAQGLFGKSAIHPEQVPVIESAYQVRASDLHAAEQILAADAAPVFRHNGAMCEPATHRTWASLIHERARLYGVRDVLPRAHLLKRGRVRVVESESGGRIRKNGVPEE